MVPPPKRYVLVTGGLGLIGGALVRSLAKRGIATVVVDRKEPLDSPKRILPPFREFWSPEEMWHHLDTHPPSAIFHLGAITDTQERDWGRLERDNLHFSQKLWQYAQKQKVPFLYASSAATYGDGSQGFSDDEKSLPQLRPLNLYGRSKHLFDLWAWAQHKKGLSPPHWAGFKFFNVYGPYEFHKGKMASMAFQLYCQIVTSGKVRLFQSHHPHYSHGGQRRDFIYVEDVVDVLLFGWQHPLLPGIYNVGTGQSYSFLELAMTISRLLQKPLHVEFIPMPAELRESYQNYTCAPIQKLRNRGYTTPFTSLEEGLKRYIEVLLENKKSPATRSDRGD